MRILLTAGASELAAKLAQRLTSNHHVRLTDRVPAPATHDYDGVEYALSALGHDASTRLLLQDRDALILTHHQPLADDTAPDIIDTATRGAYNLLFAAVEAGVRRVILLSTLDLMKAYAPDMNVSERWRPRPTTDPRLLAAYLTEATCREFGREHKLNVTVLRIGDIQADDATPESGSAALRLRDLAQAVERALAADPAPWSVYHIQSNVPEGRFTTKQAQDKLGFLAQ